MNSRLWKPWLIATITVAVIGGVIRSLWQIVVIPTPGTMLIFIPAILAMISGNAFLFYVVIKLERLSSLLSLTILTLILSGGMIAGIIHFIYFIISPLADPFWSKLISACILSACVSGYFLLLWFLWSLRNKRQSNG